MRSRGAEADEKLLLARPHPKDLNSRIRKVLLVAEPACVSFVTVSSRLCGVLAEPST